MTYPLVMGIGRFLFDEEMKRADQLWKQRVDEPEVFEPTPARLRSMSRSKRKYVMLDASKGRIQEGKRGRGAKSITGRRCSR